MTDSERAELDALNAHAWERDSETGQFYHWTQAERDRVIELMRKRDPAIQFAPSTATMADRFGHLARNWRPRNTPSSRT